MMIQYGRGKRNFLHRKDGVTQGDPFNMITYIVVVIPLIRELGEEHP